MTIDKRLTGGPITPAPRPIAERICICGCGHSFIPSRRDKVYLNNQHANYGYNHGKRKSKNRNRIRDEKILLKNDNILEKHFKSGKGQDEIERFYLQRPFLLQLKLK